MAFVYDSGKIAQLEKVGGLSIPPSDLHSVKVDGATFTGFDRSPYMTAFRAGDFTFLLLNVHLYYGDTGAKAMGRRAMETFAVARWADKRRTDPHAYTHNIIALGDFNLPQAVKGDAIFDQLTSRGLLLPDHSTAIGSSIVNDEHYDQIAFFPGEVQANLVQSAVYDYDGAIFRSLWERPGDTKHADFYAYLRYYISDHRPLWAEFKTSALHAPV